MIDACPMKLKAKDERNHTDKAFDKFMQVYRKQLRSTIIDVITIIYHIDAHKATLQHLPEAHQKLPRIDQVNLGVPKNSPFH